MQYWYYVFIPNKMKKRGFTEVIARHEMKIHITSACSRQRTRCPFVCMLAGSHFRTQMANTCTAADAGVMQEKSRAT